jgi:pimeloyl-ACP methyl ester carboxylesterase
VYALIDKEVAKETTDALFVLDQVEKMNEDSISPFFHHLDKSKVGVLGYSLGGAVGAEAAYRDPRIRAVVDLDTPLYGESGKHGISQPLLLLCEELTHSTPEELARMSYGQRRDTEMDEGDYARQLPLLQTARSYQIALHGTLHTSFQDVIFTSPLQRFSGAGAIPPQRMNLILRQYTLAFFNQTLRGIPSPLLIARTSPFPEATVLFSSASDGTQAQ